MAKDTKNKKEKKERKTFFKDFKAELKKVTWPTAKQLVNKTIAVIVIVLIISAIVFALDFAFDKGYEAITTKASNMLKKDETTQTDDTVEDLEVTDATEDTDEDTAEDADVEVTTDETNTETDDGVTAE